MSQRYLTRVLGDSDTPLHRSALAGNAMLFNANRWVRIQNGTDQVIDLIRENRINNTIVVSFFVTGNLNQTVFFAQARTTGPTFNNFEDINLYSRLFNSTSLQLDYIRSQRNFGEVTIRTPFGNKSNVRITAAFVKRSGVFSNSTYNGFQNSLVRTTVEFFGPPIPITGLLSSTATDFSIGRITSDGVNAGGAFNSFIGYIRSFEILPFDLSNEEIRAVFNYGTIYAAYQAGKVNIPNLRELMSIDFNRINGQAPICRPSTRQLTVTPYNNSTPDTAGTTYADFYSL
jgi:hypothetical protein